MVNSIQCQANCDEIGQLTQLITQMAELIAIQNAQIKSQDQQLQEILTNLSHDLRTPLTAMQGYLETLLLKSAQLSAEDRQHYLEIAVRQSRRVGHLAQELFELAKLEANDMQTDFEAFCLAELVQDIVQKFKSSTQTSTKLICSQFQPSLPIVYADIGMVERVLSILIAYIIYMQQQSNRIQIFLEFTGIAVHVTVSDRHTVIAKDLLAGLFQRHAQLKHSASHHPHNLSLLIAQHILRLHGSCIQVQSGHAYGTQFQFNLPAARRHQSGYI